MSHCSCCYPQCPVPTIECEDKEVSVSYFQGYSAFTRYPDRTESGWVGGSGNALPDQYPAACLKYKTRQYVHDWTTPYSYVQKSLTGTADEWVEFTRTISGTATMSKSIDHVGGCHAYSESWSGSGSITEETKDYTRYESSPGVYDTFLAEHVTIVWTYDTGDDWTKETTTVTKASAGATPVTTVTTATVSFSSVGSNFWTDSADWLRTRSHTEDKTTHWVNDGGDPDITATGTYVDKETLTSPWTEAAILADLTPCLASESWSAGVCSAGYAVTYNGSSTECVASIELRAYRYRFVIPDDFDPPPLPHPQKWHGEYHAIEYQEIFTPADHDPLNPELSPKVITDKSVEWTGPGTLGDADSWKTPWVEVDPPAQPSTIMIELVRSRCTHSVPWTNH